MAAAILLVPSYVIDWEAISSFADEEIIHALQTSESFTDAQMFQHQICEACCILHIENLPAVPYSMIGRLFGIAKTTVRYHYKQYTDHESIPRLNGRPSILSPAEHEDLIRKIVDGYTEREPWTMAEILKQIQSVSRKMMDRNSVRYMLDRDPRVKSCHGI
jgi:hypothetical protein